MLIGKMGQDWLLLNNGIAHLVINLMKQQIRFVIGINVLTIPKLETEKN